MRLERQVYLRCCCCCSVAKSCPTLCDPMDCSTSGFPVLHHLPEFAQTHVHWVNDAIQPSHPLLPPSSPAVNLSQNQGLFFTNELALRIRWPKYWSFSISPSNEYSGLISFRTDWFDLLAVQGTLKSPPAPQFESINSSALSTFCGPSLTFVHDSWKNHSFTIQAFVSKVMSLPFNMLSRFVIAFLPRSKHPLISWLRSPSDVILEPKKIKSVSFHFFPPALCHEIMGPDAMILVFWMLNFKPAFSLGECCT